MRDYLTLTTWTNHCSWPMRNIIYCSETVISCYGCSRKVLVTCALIQVPRQFDNVFLLNLHPKCTVQGTLLLLLGMLLGFPFPFAIELVSQGPKHTTPNSRPLHLHWNDWVLFGLVGIVCLFWAHQCQTCGLDVHPFTLSCFWKIF